MLTILSAGAVFLVCRVLINGLGVVFWWLPLHKRFRRPPRRLRALQASLARHLPGANETWFQGRACEIYKWRISTTLMLAAFAGLLGLSGAQQTIWLALGERGGAVDRVHEFFLQTTLRLFINIPPALSLLLTFLAFSLLFIAIIEGYKALSGKHAQPAHLFFMSYLVPVLLFCAASLAHNIRPSPGTQFMPFRAFTPTLIAIAFIPTIIAALDITIRVSVRQES